jgi:hypothetical protein
VSWTGVAVMLLEGGEVIDKSCGELYRDRSRYSGEEERERQRWICSGLEALGVGADI